MQTLKFMSKVVEERGGAIRFIRAEEEGLPCWFYLKIDPSKLSEYEHKLKEGSMNIRDYGQILQSDWGNYPPADMISFMRETYAVETLEAE